MWKNCLCFEYNVLYIVLIPFFKKKDLDFSTHVAAIPVYVMCKIFFHFICKKEILLSVAYNMIDLS